MPDRPRATVIGAGLAGSEAAWQLAERDIVVTLVEMRPGATTPAHHTAELAELVCSNSFKSDDPGTAAGLLKRELERLGSVVLACARATAIPAGAALAVDRERFSALVSRTVAEHPNVAVQRREADAIPADEPVIVATGPLTSDAMERALSQLIGEERLAFFDAAAPIVEAASLDRTIVFAASRYGKGSGADYLNAPLTRDEYDAFLDALLTAARVRAKLFETRELFAACKPVEEVARTGRDALRYGAMRPVGLTDPRTGKRPWAVVQLRAENAPGGAYNLVGFQTNLTFGEQRRVFRTIPGLAEAEFVRCGVMHRNTFVDAPRLLTPGLALRKHSCVHLAGQLTGTEGYLEAVGSGLGAALDVSALLAGAAPFELPPTTALGSLLAYATGPATEAYQPMHVNFGLMPPLEPPVRGKRERYSVYADRALRDLDAALRARPDLGFDATRPAATAASTQGLPA